MTSAHLGVDLDGRRAHARAVVRDLIDRLVGSDPGFNRLRVALLGVASIAAALAAEYGFVRATGALQATVPAGASAAVRTTIAAGNHDLLVIAMMLGLLVNLFVSLGVGDPTLRRQLVSMALVPGPLLVALVLGLSLGGIRPVALASFPVLLVLAGLARRFGPRGVLVGMPVFVGDFIGFFLHGEVAIGDVGWLAAEVGVGVVAGAAVRIAVFRPDAGAALRRSQRAWMARARGVARVAADLFDAGAGPDDPDVARLHRRLTRLNESSLIIDVQLAEPGALPVGSSARRLHERLFEAELGLTNLARFAMALGRLDLDPDAHDAVAGALDAIRADRFDDAVAAAHALLDALGENPLGVPSPDGAGAGPGDEARHARVLLHRFATSVVLYGEAEAEWVGLGARADGDDGVFSPAVNLVNGWLPGSSEVSATASAQPGRHLLERPAMAPYLRSAIQMGVAVAAAVVVGDVLSGRRFYWAVIAAFVSFYGANNTVEQIRKAWLRVLGTVVGILVGSLLASAVGRSVPGAVAIILVCIFAGLYLFRINYAFMTVAVTISVSLLYEQLSEFSESLLALRLGETLVGAAAAVATVLVVLPLRTSRVLDVALGELLGATRALVLDAVADLTGTGSPRSLIEASRRVDTAFQGLVSTARPLRHLGEGGRRAQRIAVAAGALRHYGRNLAGDVPTAGGAPGAAAAGLAAGRDALVEGIDGITAVVGGAPAGVYVRSASLWNLLEQRAVDAMRRAVASGDVPEADMAAITLAARDLQLLDGALAELAALEGMELHDLDTGVVRAAAGRSPTPA